MTIHLGRLLPNASCNQPGRRRGNSPSAIPIRFCSRWGLPCRLCYQKRGALLPHPFTLARSRKKRRFAFCGTFPRVAPAGSYPAPCLRGARTFLSTSQIRWDIDQQSGHPVIWHAFCVRDEGRGQAIQHPGPTWEGSDPDYG